ncbi:MAG TPA: AAA family ATPase [Kofleriaceae bacterium]|nr:AAA family ATPase [Kofleriaceae bacterium]
MDFTAERQRHARFVRRTDVLARLDEWLLGPGEAGWVVVTGGPGMGKSALLSAWVARREAAGAAVPHHFIRRQVADWDQPEAIAASLAAQLEAAYPELRDPCARPERRLLELLGRVGKRLGPAERVVLVIDGLDETRGEPGDNPLPRFLPQVVPPGIRLLCATRPKHPHLRWLDARSPLRRLDLDDPRWAESNARVVRGFWEAVAAEYQPPLPAATIEAAIARADGNVLHAVMLHDALRDLPAAERRADRIPRGLKALIGEIWDRAAACERVRAGLGLLCAAREALAVEVLTDLAGWSYDDRERFVRDARQLLLEEPGSAEAYRPRHDWVRELIAERLGAGAIRAHHETLAKRLATWPPPTDEPRRRYAVRHALAHRLAIAAGDFGAVRDLAADLGYLEARAQLAEIAALEQELAEAGKRCPGPAAARDLNDLAQAIAREAHWIRSYPAETAGLVWNRLRRMGRSEPDLAERLALPPEAAFLHVRHAERAERAPRSADGHTDAVRACAVTPDGRRVLSASVDRTLKLWDLETGRLAVTLEGHADAVLACAVTPDGRRAISGSVDRTLKVWDLAAGRAVATLEGHTGWVRACAVTPDGSRAVSASDDRTLEVWDLPAGRRIATLSGHTDWVTACAITPDGRRVISASDDRTLKVWDLETGHVLATLEGHTDWVHACAITPDGRRVLSGSTDRTLKLWDVETGRVLASFEAHATAVRACAVLPDGRRAVSASDDGTLKIWDLGAGHATATLVGHTDGLRACAVTPDGRRVISGSDDGTLKVWDPDAGREVAAIEGRAAGARACALTPDDRRVVTAFDDGALEVRDLETGKVAATWQAHAAAVRACAATPDGRRAVSASSDRTLKVWDLASGRLVATLEGHAGWVRAVAVSPDGRRVISGSDDRTLRVWELASGRPLATLEGHTGWVRAVAVSPEGRRVLSASTDGTLKVWDLLAGRALATLAGHVAGVRACTVTADGRRAISASDDRTLKVWDLLAGRCLATFSGHTHGVRACALTPDGRHVISASVDRTLKVWELESGHCLYTHHGETVFRCVAATGAVIVAADSAGTVWTLEWPREAAPRRTRPRKTTKRRAAALGARPRKRR